MQGGRGNRHPFFDMDDPFTGFGSFGGGFGGHGSLLSGFFGGRNPFDDPFFSRPFGSLFESSVFGSAGSPFMGAPTPGFLEHQPSQPNRSRGPIIEELNSDDEKEDEGAMEKKDNPRKHARSGKGPYIEDPDEDGRERKSKQMQLRHDFNRANNIQSQPHSHGFTFQSSTVTYGGANGAYYTSSQTRRTGSDGFSFEELKEADSASGQATHRVSRGIHEKGHSVERKLKSDGKVDTMQTLHNLNEDQLASFEETWKGNARRHLPGWNEGPTLQDGSTSALNGSARRGGWALPSAGVSRQSGGTRQITGDSAAFAHAEPSGMRRADIRDGPFYQGRSSGAKSNMDHVRRHKGA